MNPEFKPGTFGYHELADRSCLVAELFSHEIVEHPASKHPQLRKRIRRLEKELYELYQRIAYLDFATLDA